ncbi:Putative regulatory protein [Salinisphaera shabanensis E1L3A]|uniref:diguanylate cyclase n=1 Tax=Salinisphaera shabanensis E1L3A TaxID=1033802 RepID=U2ERP3_9GAMM|nr:GGDEF domain-containing protein [Salinisphaera shabanensis]ERJ20410.1 Putative regulatory protein [Salinisphaera shabanensis E1L3A]
MKSSTTDLHNPNLVDGMQPNDATKSPPTRLIQRQIDRGFVGLRFLRPLERDFHDYLRHSSRLSRAGLIFFALAGVFSCALIDVRWLDVPYELVGATRFIQVSVMAPMIFLCLFLCLRVPTSAAMELGTALMFVVMSASLLSLRVVYAQAGFQLPLELIGASAVAMLCLSRIRFWIQLALLAFVAAVVFMVEAWFVTIDAAYGRYTTALLFVVAVIAGYSSEYTIRWTWLTGTLLRYTARLDRLTGLLNRHALENALENAHDYAQREKKSYAVAMIDIDAFGAYNNYYGHQHGDIALQKVADALAHHARRPLDFCGRYGGEEFLLLWMDCGPEQAYALAESVREVVEHAHIAHDQSPVGSWVTVSVGLCHVDAEHASAPTSAVLREADRMLYQAKGNGRNRVGYLRFNGEIAPL